MSHIKGSQDRDLHDENGEHIGTAPTTDGRDLERHERRIRAHLEAHHRQQDEPSDEAREAQAAYDDEWGPSIEWPLP